MPKQVDHDKQRERILEAASAVFSERGVEGTGLIHVARELKVSRPSLYTYYADKDALLDDLVGFSMERVVALFQSVINSPGTPTERIEALTVGMSKLMNSKGHSTTVMLQLWGTRPEMLERGSQAMTKELGKVIAEGQKNGEFTDSMPTIALTRGVVAIIDGMIFHTCLGYSSLPTKYLLAHVRALLHINSD